MSGAASLDMTLEDLMKSNKKSGGLANFRCKGRASSGPGPAHRFPNRGANRTAPYDPKVRSLYLYVCARQIAPESTWKHDLFNGDQATAYPGQADGRSSSLETGTKLYVSNLEYGVSNEDVKELFSEVGDLKRYSIHYDKSGRSKGTAEVVFSQRQDALSAFKKYNNVQLDGKPMKIEIVGTNIVTPAMPPSANGSFGNLNGVPRSGQGRGGALGRIHGGVNGGRGFGRGRGEKTSAEDFDADLDKYLSEAMQIN